MVLLRLPQTIRARGADPRSSATASGRSTLGRWQGPPSEVFALTGPGTRPSAGSKRAGPSGPTPFARMTKSGYLTVTASSAATSAAGATAGASATGSGLGSPLAAVCVQPGDVPGAVRRTFWPAAGWLYAAQSLETVGTVLPASGASASARARQRVGRRFRPRAHRVRGRLYRRPPPHGGREARGRPQDKVRSVAKRRAWVFLRYCQCSHSKKRGAIAATASPACDICP